MYSVIITIFCFVLIINYRSAVREIIQLRRELVDRTISLEIPIIELGDMLYENDIGQKLYFVDTKFIEIDNDDEYFYKTVEEQKNKYKEFVMGYQEIYKLLQDGVSVEAILKDEKLSDIASSCFNIQSRINGIIMNGIIRLNDGRHRYVVAKELGVKIPVFVSGQMHIWKRMDSE